MGKRYAAIDIGSNAVRLLIKQRREEQGDLEKALLLRVPLRLGFDVFSVGCVGEAKIRQLRHLMKAFRQLMKVYDVQTCRACATSAMRDAANGEAVINKIRKDTGFQVEIISGQQEASLILGGALERQTEETINNLYVDVGGGSTEISLISGDRLLNSASYDIGTVRLLFDAVKEESWRRMEDDLRALSTAYRPLNIIGSGGNINKLYRLAEKKDKRLGRMSVSSLQQIYDRLLPLTPAERQERFALKEDRADVIVPAGKIFLRIARTIGAEYVQVPVRGLADGIIEKLAESEP